MLQFQDLIEEHWSELSKLDGYNAANCINQLRLYWNKYANNDIDVERLTQLAANHLVTYEG